MPISATDNVKLERSLLGKIFGWRVITIETGSESYSLSYVSTNEAGAFRKAPPVHRMIKPVLLSGIVDSL